MNERLRQIRLSLGGSQKAFSERFGIAQQTYANYETGKTSIPDEIKQKLAQMGIDIHWLVTGEGEMIHKVSASQQIKSKEVSVNNPESLLGVSFSKLTNLAYINRDEDSIPIPFISQKLSAGPGQLWNEDCFTDDVIAIPTRMVKRFKGYKLGAAEVRGDSMDPSLQNGDIIIFAEKMISGNGIYALSIDAEVYVKRIEFDPFDETLRVISDNPKYDAKILPADTDRVQILGKIIGRFLVYW